MTTLLLHSPPGLHDYFITSFSTRPTCLLYYFIRLHVYINASFFFFSSSFFSIFFFSLLTQPTFVHNLFISYPNTFRILFLYCLPKLHSYLFFPHPTTFRTLVLYGLYYLNVSCPTNLAHLTLFNSYYLLG